MLNSYFNSILFCINLELWEIDFSFTNRKTNCQFVCRHKRTLMYSKKRRGSFGYFQDQLRNVNKKLMCNLAIWPRHLLQTCFAALIRCFYTRCCISNQQIWPCIYIRPCIFIFAHTIRYFLCCSFFICLDYLCDF